MAPKVVTILSSKEKSLKHDRDRHFNPNDTKFGTNVGFYKGTELIHI